MWNLSKFRVGQFRERVVAKMTREQKCPTVDHIIWKWIMNAVLRNLNYCNLRQQELFSRNANEHFPISSIFFQVSMIHLFSEPMTVFIWFMITIELMGPDEMEWILSILFLPSVIPSKFAEEWRMVPATLGTVLSDPGPVWFADIFEALENCQSLWTSSWISQEKTRTSTSSHFFSLLHYEKWMGRQTTSDMEISNGQFSDCNVPS
jgi:hypothetical protein